VTIERDNKLLGVGSVLSGDGRILTALSTMGGVDHADVRYADGNTVKVRVGHRDNAWDLALLVPQTGKWLDGLTASEADPGAAELKTFVARGPRMLGVVPTVLKGRTEARARAGEVLPGALDFDIKGGIPSIGAPILDGNGNVIGVFMQGCKVNDAGACMPMTLGAPIHAIRRFLAATPASAVAPPPWLGIRGESDAWGSIRGVRVIAVANGSPADKGGLKANLERSKGDLIVAVNGAPVDTAEKLAETIGKHAVGDTVKLLVFGGAFREVTVVLRSSPDTK
jgi:serine protease Do